MLTVHRVSSPLSLGAAVGLLGLGIAATPAEAYSGRICYMGDWISIWVEWSSSNVIGNYDPVAHTGLINIATDGPFNQSDFIAIDVPDGSGGTTTLQGGQESIMTSYEVLDGLGTARATVDFLGIWVGAYGYSFHLIVEPGAAVTAALPLTGFTAGGEGVYFADGLSIPVSYEVTTPDGTPYVIPDVIHALELRTPLDLSPPPCLVDLDANGILDLRDINLFVQGFLGGCP
ncbi:MAG: hypothetical protein H6810_09515 [Phycisphaeraceae bacterium]|nr:MAG: hypothetical protein H6810_09515 [Phycisphaeraceae bacterium]